jgi:hypothetical protein
MSRPTARIVTCIFYAPVLTALVFGVIALAVWWFVATAAWIGWIFSGKLLSFAPERDVRLKKALRTIWVIGAIAMAGPVIGPWLLSHLLGWFGGHDIILRAAFC